MMCMAIVVVDDTCLVFWLELAKKDVGFRVRGLRFKVRSSFVARGPARLQVQALRYKGQEKMCIHSSPQIGCSLQSTTLNPEQKTPKS